MSLEEQQVQLHTGSPWNLLRKLQEAALGYKEVIAACMQKLDMGEVHRSVLKDVLSNCCPTHRAETRQDVVSLGEY